MQLDSEHKVLVVLDHGPKFAASSNTKMSVFLKDSSTGAPRVAAVIDKSVWSVAVECALDMHRVVGDLFPEDGKLMRFVLSDCVGRFLTPHWGERLITQQELMHSLASAGPATASEDSSILNGIRMAVDALSEKTKLYTDTIEREEAQQQKRGKGVRRPRIPIPLRNQVKTAELVVKKPKNEGSIVIFTTLDSEKELDELEADIIDIIKGRNMILGNLTDKENSFVPIDHVKLFIMNIYQPHEESKVQQREMREDPAFSHIGATREILGEFLNNEFKIGLIRSRSKIVHTVTSLLHLREIHSNTIAPFVSSRIFCCVSEGEKLRGATHAVTMQLYDLVSTTVSGIPMKEESLPNQSTNYDVELFHPKKAHQHLEKIGLLEHASHLLAPMGAYETVKLAWATPSPKSKWNLFPRASCSVRVSPAICNSRQSVCLTSFLINGRNVMLEVSRQGVVSTMQPNVNNKLISHTLISHGGRIYIHAIRIGQDPVLDNSSLRLHSIIRPVSGLRANDFKKLIEESMIKVDKTTMKQTLPSGNDSTVIPCEQPLKHLRRITRFWPTRLEDTFIYNIPARFDTIFTLLRKQEMTASESDACKQFICGLMTMKERGEGLTDEKFKCSKIKNLNNSEQMAVALPELALHFSNYVNHSEKHLELLQMFMNLTGLGRAVSVNTKDVDLCEKPGQITALPPVRISPNETIRNHSRSNSPLTKKAKKAQYCWKVSETVNLYQWISEQQNRSLWSRWRDFEGRNQAGDKPARLYPQLDLNNAPKKGEVP